VQVGQNGPYVFVVKADSTLDLRQVKPGQRQDGDTTVIINGVKPGESVVTRGQLQLAPGMKVAAQEDPGFPSRSSAAGHDDAADGVAHRLRHPHFKQLAVNDLPAVDYPVISVSASYPGRESGDDGEHDRDAARETVHPNSRADPLDQLEHAGFDQHHLQFDLDKSIIDASTDVQAAIQRAAASCLTTCRARRVSRNRIRTISRSCIWR
jgi:hypothetical protein